MKGCVKCKVEKEVGEFYKDKSAKDGLTLRCKSCCKEHDKEYQKEYRKSDKYKEYRKSDKYREYVREYQKEYQKSDKYKEYRKSDKYKEHQKEYQKEYRKSDKYKEYHKEYQREYQREYQKSDRYKEYQKEYRKSDKYREYVREYQKEYQKSDNSKEYRKGYHKEYQKGRRATDPLFRLSCLLRKLIRSALSYRKHNYTKRSRTHELLGADFPTVQLHLISTAVLNYGKYFPKRKYHIDHIIPCASATTEEELIALQHYTNLQYLHPKDNLEKSDRLDWKLPTLQNNK